MMKRRPFVEDLKRNLHKVKVGWIGEMKKSKRCHKSRY